MSFQGGHFQNNALPERLMLPSKVGLKAGFRESLKVGLKHKNRVPLTYLQGPPETHFRTYF